MIHRLAGPDPTNARNLAISCLFLDSGLRVSESAKQRDQGLTVSSIGSFGVRTKSSVRQVMGSRRMVSRGKNGVSREATERGSHGPFDQAGSRKAEDWEPTIGIEPMTSFLPRMCSTN